MFAFAHAYRIGGGSPGVIESGASGSAFSRGDLVSFIGSKISKMAPAATNADIGGIALADSTDSINGLIPVCLIDDADVFFASAPAANTLARGAEVDVGTANGVLTSSNTAKCVVVKGPDEVLGQSNASRVLVKFIVHSSNIDLS